MSSSNSSTFVSTLPHATPTVTSADETVAGVSYYRAREISTEQYCTLLAETSLGARRPLVDRARISAMLEHSDLLVSAWQGERLVGIARSVTDFYYCCYLADLAVSEQAQACGIGRELIRQTFYALQPDCKILLLAAPQSVDFYPKVGFTRHPSGWLMQDVSALR